LPKGRTESHQEVNPSPFFVGRKIVGFFVWGRVARFCVPVFRALLDDRYATRATLPVRSAI